ncbi:MAG: hypothetical protein GY853_06730 [PVC group bacterium]|nr:hypothetical protein [PVC group bacterium]
MNNDKIKKQKESSWRDCKKGNPDQDGTYIIYTADKSTAMCHFSNNEWQGWRNVLAWMPIPDKPDFL